MFPCDVAVLASSNAVLKLLRALCGASPGFEQTGCGPDLSMTRWGLRKHQPVLLLELSDRALNHQKATSADVLALLAAHGYRVYGFDGKSGLPVLLEPASYRDTENVVAVVGPAPW